MSAEHLISKSLFITDAVTVQGFPWCKTEPKTIGLANLTAKILCDHHNNLLSTVADDPGEHAFSVLRDVRKLTNIREKMKPRIWNVKKYTIDGPGLERWFLKTLINISCNGKVPIGPNASEPGRPSADLVEIAFARRTFEGRAGLYDVVRTGMTARSTDAIGFTPLLHEGHIEGGLFSFRGLRFLLFLGPEGPPTPLTGIMLEGEDLGNCQLNYHNRSIRQTTGRYLSQLVTTRW